MKSLELFDETLDINSTENYEMAVQAGPDGLSFCLLDTLRNKFVLIRSFEPDENKYFNAGNITDFINKDDFLTKKYRKTRLVMPSQKFTLVPSPLFDIERKDEYFNFNLKRDDNNVILSDQVGDPDVFIVFSIQATFREALNSFYPGIRPNVHMVPLFDNISRSRRSLEGNYIHVHVERDYFNLVIFSGNELKFCNTYSYRNISDILYYVLNVFNRMELKQQETIFFSGFTDKFDELISAFSVYIRSVRVAAPKGNFTFSYVFDELGLHRYLNLFSIFNCG